MLKRTNEHQPLATRDQQHELQQLKKTIIPRKDYGKYSNKQQQKKTNEQKKRKKDRNRNRNLIIVKTPKKLYIEIGRK